MLMQMQVGNAKRGVSQMYVRTRPSRASAAKASTSRGNVRFKTFESDALSQPPDHKETRSFIRCFVAQPHVTCRMIGHKTNPHITLALRHCSCLGREDVRRFLSLS